MSSPRLDRRTLSKAKPDDLIRLARFVGADIPNDCTSTELVEIIVRKLDTDEMSWPPKLYESKW